MTRTFRALLAASLTATATGVAAPPATAQTVAITNVTVIPMDRERTLPGQTVLVQDGRIARIGATGQVQVPSGAVTVDGGGKFLLPGLAEMHGHLPGSNAPAGVVQRVLALFALNGVTQIRGMLGDTMHLTLAKRAERGEILSPHILVGGPSLNGNSVPTPDAGRAAVTAQDDAGYDLLKIHPGVTREVFDTIAATADRLGIRFAGHVPLDVGIERAIEAKYWSVEHIDGFLEGLVPSDRPFTNEEDGFFGMSLVSRVDMSRLPGLVERAKRNGVWVTPTQVLMDNLAGTEPVEQMLQRPEHRYWMPQQLQQWGNVTREIRSDPSFTDANREKFLTVRRQIIKALHDGGVGFVLGSDAPQMWNVPGFSIARELRSLVAAGLSPYQALESGTRNIAVFMGNAKDAGTVEEGKRADLLLLDANPLEDVWNVSRVSGVVLRGRWISGEERARRLKELETA